MYKTRLFVPTADIDIDHPCGDCEIYRGGADACHDCTVMARWMIMTGQSQPDYYCVNCDCFRDVRDGIICRYCNSPLEYVEAFT